MQSVNSAIIIGPAAMAVGGGIISYAAFVAKEAQSSWAGGGFACLIVGLIVTLSVFYCKKLIPGL